MTERFNNKKAVIFDLDGTLANTISAIAHAVNLTMKHFGYPERDEATVLNAVGNGATNLIRRLVPVKIAAEEELVLRSRNKYDEMYALTYMETKEMYDGIAEAVRILHEEKGLKIAVFSNKQDEYVKSLTDQFFPDGTVSVSRGQTDLPIKPDIAGLIKILEELGVTPAECVFVGDSGVDTETAKNADMDFIGVAWGFWGKERMLASGAKTVIDKPEELVNIIN
jgi:phosphoglycolate phosphatase